MSPAIKTSAVLGFLASIASVSAHGYVQGIDVDGTYYTGYLVNQYPWQSNHPSSIGWTQTATDLGYIAPDSFTSPDIICHRGSSNAALSATVAAGATVRMDWNTWPESHHGPIIDYIASCSNGDCSTVDKTTLEFVKIAEKGLMSDDATPGKWASDELIANNNTWAVKIPASLAPGNYVLRHEIIALHSANNANGAQNYPQCINLKVTGSGTDSISGGVVGEKLYTPTDAGILVNIWDKTGMSYAIPGPKVWSAGLSAVVNVEKADVATSSANVEAVPTTMATIVRPSATSSVVVTQTPEPTPAPAQEEEDDDETCEA